MICATATLLREARSYAGLTQADLARLAGTKQSAISAYETGRREPNLATLRRLLAAAGFDLQLRTEAKLPATRHLPDTPVTRRLEEQRDSVIAVIAAYGGSNVRVFGSVARGEASSESDLDLLVDLPARTGVLTLGRIAAQIERLVDMQTDIVPVHALRPEIARRILAEAVPL